MILYHGNRATLTNLPWNALILSSDTRSDFILRAVTKAMKRFTAMEVFVPANGTCYIYARGRQQDIEALSRIAGIQELASTERLIPMGKNEEPRVRRTPITLPDIEVQEMITRSKAKHEERIASIKRNSFVRILDGQAKNYCGYVTKLNKKQATVRITMFSRTLLVTTPQANLEALHIPPEHRTYYYSPAIEAILQEEPSLKLPLSQETG